MGKQVLPYQEYVLLDLRLALCSQTGRWPKVLPLFAALDARVNFIHTIYCDALAAMNERGRLAGGVYIEYFCDNWEDKCAY